MVAPNGIYFVDSEVQWYCSPCGRFFVSENAIHAHCDNAAVHSGEWCDRCKWLFVSRTARMDHHQHSRHHHVCPNCQVDFDSMTDLYDHMEKRYFYCKRCLDYVKDGQGRKSEALWHAHQVRTHFMCAKCDTYFENQNNVDQHQQVHLPRDKECYGCYRNFPTLSAMMIHLESGNCSSQVTTDDINNWTLQYSQLNRYIDPQAPNRYECPRCENQFSYLSGLLQHLESNACDGSIDKSLRTLPKFLAKKLSHHDSY